MKSWPCAILVAGLCPLAVAAANKCTDLSGRVTFQDEPCSLSTREGQAAARKEADERRAVIEEEQAKRREAKRIADERIAKVVAQLNDNVLLERFVCIAAIRDLLPGSNPRYESLASEAGRKYGVYRSTGNARNTYGCYVTGQRILWRVESAAAIEKGRWRNDPADEVLSYSITGTTITIRTELPDRSGREKAYDALELTASVGASAPGNHQGY